MSVSWPPSLHSGINDSQSDLENGLNGSQDVDSPPGKRTRLCEDRNQNNCAGQFHGVHLNKVGNLVQCCYDL